MKLSTNKYLSQSILLEERGAPGVLKVILIFLVFLLVFFLFWSSKVELKETATARGELIPGEGIIILEIPQGGVLEELFVENNQMVEAGDPILQLKNDSLLYTLEEERIRGKVLEIEKETLAKELQTLQDLRTENLVSIQEYQSVLGEWVSVDGALSVSVQKQKRLGLELQNYMLKAPIKGRIHGLGDLHFGSVVSVGENICQILPDEGEFLAEVSIDPRYRGRLEVGQVVELQFPSYEYGRFGGITASLDEISGTTYLSQNGDAFYKGIIRLPEKSIHKDGHFYPLMLGMPVIAEIETGKKTLLQYIIFPVKASLKLAFREE